MKFFRFVPLSLLMIVWMTNPALAGECKKIHGTIVDAQVTEGCTSPNKFCAAGTVEGNHGLSGQTWFVMDGAVRGPATAPGSIATSGILIYTMDGGTLTVRESGLSGLKESGNGYFTAFQEVLEGTGDYQGVTGHLWVLGQVVENHFESELSGVLCEP
ncbi:MAG TPA: hypothetical protein VF789_28860 [Thermoanaerobaculia bacterium]